MTKEELDKAIGFAKEILNAPQFGSTYKVLNVLAIAIVQLSDDLEDIKAELKIIRQDTIEECAHLLDGWADMTRDSGLRLTYDSLALEIRGLK